MENYEVLEHLSTGSFGKVCKIRRKSDGKVLVWKELYYGTMTEKEKQQLVSEVNILRELRHPNIVRYYDRIIDKQNQKIWIVMEYCEGGDMLQAIKKLKKDKQLFPEETVWKFFMQIVLALHEIHRRKEGKILHRDIKPANCFIDSSNNVKLGDFGLSKILNDDTGFACTKVGTPYYMSPEQIDDNRYNEKSDVWACGCLLYEMCALSPPFEASNQLSLAIKIKNGKYENIPSVYSSEIQRVIQWILTKDMNERPSVEELLNIPEISMRLREKRLKECKTMLKKKEEDCKKKVESLEQLEAELRAKESELKAKEQKLLEQERRAKEQEEQYRSNNSLNYTGESRDYSAGLNGYRNKYVSPTYSKNYQLPTTDNDFERNYRFAGKTVNRANLENIDMNSGIRYRRQASTKSEEANNTITVNDNYLNMEINTILKNMDKIAVQSAYPKEIDIKDGIDSSERENGAYEIPK